MGKTGILVICVGFLGLLKPVVGVQGSVNLDEHSFDKIVPKFETVLVKFDPSYPYGDKHEAFVTVAQELKDRQEILFAEVGIKDWGEKENENLGKRFGVNSKEDYPALRLFVQGEDEPFAFNNNQIWTPDEIKKFVREHSNIYLGLQGCLEKFDQLAGDFTGAFDKKAVLELAEKQARGLKSEADKKSSATYIKFMKKILEKESFVEVETKRLRKIIKDGKVKADKKQDLQNKLNILSAFNPIRSEL